MLAAGSLGTVDESIFGADFYGELRRKLVRTLAGFRTMHIEKEVYENVAALL